MATRAVGMTIQYVAWDTSAGAGKTGDVANHTLRWIKDGTASAPTNSPSEVDSANCPGIYKITLTSTETDCNIGTLAGKSSTSSVSIIPVTIQFERLPNAAPGSSGGLPTAGTGAHQLDLTSGRVKVQPGTSTGQIDLDQGRVKVQPGTATGQIDVTSGRVVANVTHWANQTVLTPNTNGVPRVDIDRVRNATEPADNLVLFFTTGYDARASIVSAEASSVTDKTGYTLTTAGIDAIWNRMRSADSRPTGSFGHFLDAQITEAITASGGMSESMVRDAVWGATRASYADAGTFGEALQSTVASRSTHSAADVWAVGTRRLTDATNISSTGEPIIVAAGGRVILAATTHTNAVIPTVSTITNAVTVGTNNDKTGYTLSASGADAIWDRPRGGSRVAGTFGYFLDALVSSAGGSDLTPEAIWTHATRTLTSGANIVLAKGTGVTGFNDVSTTQVRTQADNALSAVGLTSTVTGRIDATISSRSTITTGQVKAQADQAIADVGLTSTITGRIDATVSSRSTLTAAQAKTQADAALADVGLTPTVTGRIDVATSTRLAASAYTAPSNADVTAIKAKTDLLTFTGSDVRATLDGETVTVQTVLDKTGYKLASDGLNLITTADPSGDPMAWTLPQRFSGLFLRTFGHVTLTSETLTTHGSNGSTVIAQQSVSDDSVTQVQGLAS